jgi:hypothetical protein
MPQEDFPFVAEWSEEIRRHTLRFHKNNKNGKLISINVLEYASVIINLGLVSVNGLKSSLKRSK